MCFNRSWKFPTSKLEYISPLGKEINSQCYVAQFAANALYFDRDLTAVRSKSLLYC